MNTKKFIGHAVRTELGMELGQVASFDIDVDEGRVVALHVKTHRYVPELLDQVLTIDWSHVVRVTSEAVVVQDGVIPLASRSLFARTSVVPARGQAMTSTIEEA